MKEMKKMVLGGIFLLSILGIAVTVVIVNKVNSKKEKKSK